MDGKVFPACCGDVRKKKGTDAPPGLLSPFERTSPAASQQHPPYSPLGSLPPPASSSSSFSLSACLTCPLLLLSPESLHSSPIRNKGMAVKGKDGEKRLFQEEINVSGWITRIQGHRQTFVWNRRRGQTSEVLDQQALTGRSFH